MARYVITETQAHEVIYKYLDNIIDGETKTHPWNDDGYRIDMYDKNKLDVLSYYWYAPGSTYDDDDDTAHNGIGSLHVHPKNVDLFRRMFKLRESKILDIVADWFSTKIDTEVDEVTIYPYREKPPVY